MTAILSRPQYVKAVQVIVIIMDHDNRLRPEILTAVLYGQLIRDDYTQSITPTWRHYDMDTLSVLLWLLPLCEGGLSITPSQKTCKVEYLVFVFFGGGGYGYICCMSK